MYLPKSKYRIKDTYGDEFTDKNGLPYNGKAIVTSGGRVFAGDKVTNIKGILNKIQDTSLTAVERPFNDYYGPTDQDYDKGFYTRYFLRDKRNGKFSEVSLQQWKQKKTLKYILAGKFIWYLRGPVNNGEINGIPFKGTSTKNRESLTKLETKYPGVTEFFKSTSEFVR